MKPLLSPSFVPVAAACSPKALYVIRRTFWPLAFVVIRTEAETVQGDRGAYNALSGIALLGGNVRITRGQNQLNGELAEVNMKTGISRLLPGQAPGERVSGLVVPQGGGPGALPLGAPRSQP